MYSFLNKNDGTINTLPSYFFKYLIYYTTFHILIKHLIKQVGNRTVAVFLVALATSKEDEVNFVHMEYKASTCIFKLSVCLRGGNNLYCGHI
jgi:hypothetical protein